MDGHSKALALAFPMDISVFNADFSLKFKHALKPIAFSIWGDRIVVAEITGQISSLEPSGSKNGLGRLNPKKDRLKFITQNQTQVFWGLENGSLFSSLLKGQGIVQGKVPEEIQCGVLFNQRLWIGTVNGLFQWTGPGNPIEGIERDVDLPEISAEKIAAAGHHLFIASLNGLFHFNADLDEWAHFNSGNGFPNDFLNDVTVSGQTVFSATDGAGVVSFPVSWPFVRLDYFNFASGKIQIFGQVQAQSLKNCRLEIGPDIFPFIASNTLTQTILKNKTGLLGEISLTDLTPGAFIVQLTAENKKGQVNGVQMPFRFNALPPTLVVDTILRQGNKYLVTGIYKGNGVKSIRLFPGNVPAVLNPKSRSFSGEIPLNQIKESIRVVVKNTFGDSGVALKEMDEDRIPPALTFKLASPFTPLKTIQLKGTFQEEAIDRIYSTPGENRAVLNIALQTFSVALDLNEGQNRFTLIAKDKAGNKSQKEIILYADFSPPKIQLNILPTMVSLEKILIKGNLIEPHAKSVVLKPLGLSGKVLDNRFEIWAPLKEGNNAFKLSATDQAGNASLLPLNIFRDTRPPTLSLKPLPEKTQEMTLDILGQFSEKNLSGIYLFPGYIPATINFEQKSFSGKVVLSPGQNKIRAQALDRAGNKTEVLKIVHYELRIEKLKGLALSAAKKDYGLQIEKLKKENRTLKKQVRDFKKNVTNLQSKVRTLKKAQARETAQVQNSTPSGPVTLNHFPIFFKTVIS